MPPTRRPSVGTDAAANPGDDAPAGSASRGSRAGRGSVSRIARGERGRSKGRSGSTGSAAAALRGEPGHRRGSDEEDDADDDAGYSRSPSSSVGGLPRALSPELGVPSAAPAFQRPSVGLPRSSSLSLLSDDRSSSPATPAPGPSSSRTPNGAVAASDDAEDTFMDSPLSTATVRAAETPARPDGGRLEAPSSALAAGSTRTVDDSLSELDTSDDEKRVGADAAAESSEDEPLASTSAFSPAPAVATAPRPQLESESPAPAAPAAPVPTPKRRGRPPGSKTKHLKAPVPRSQRAAAKADPPYRAPSGSDTGAGSPGAPGSGARQRATRANVTLPPGYIEGVTSSRWPKAGAGRKKRDEEGHEREDEEDEDAEAETPEAKTEDVTGTTTPVDESRASSVNGLGGPNGTVDGAEGDEKKLALPAPVDRKGKGRAVDAEDDDDVSMNGGDGTLGVSAPMSRETSVDERSVTPAVSATPTKGKGKGKGKRGKKAQPVPEPVERAKRRKLDIPDKEAGARRVAREAARVKFLDQLDAELDQVEDRSHPLLDIAYQRLREEKADRLERLRRYQDEREKELELMLDKRLQASWRQWADQKDALRMKLYLENHTSLKELVAEEKVFPFFRDHPLFVNNHDLPPTSYYRGPQRDPAFQPREILHAGHYVEPPPLNPALTHESWQLAPEEIEADLALFYDIEDEPFYAPPPPAPVPSAPSVGMFPYAHPPFYYDPLAAPPPGAAPYLSAPGYGPPAPPIPPPGAPYGLPAYYAPPPPPPPPVSGPLSAPGLAPPHTTYAAPGYPYDRPAPASVTAQPAPAPVPAPAREPAPSPAVQHSPRPPQQQPAAPAPPVQPKISPTLPKAAAPAPPTHVKPPPAVNGGSARSPPLPPMQMQRPPSTASPRSTSVNGHGYDHETGHSRSNQHHAPAPAPRPVQQHPYAQQQQHQPPPRQHTHHSHPPTFPTSQPPSPSRPREQHPQPPTYATLHTAQQRFSPSFGGQNKPVSSAPGGSSKSQATSGSAAPQAHAQGHSQSSLPPLRGTLFPSMPTPAPPVHPVHSPSNGVGLAPPTLPSLSRKTTPGASPGAGSPPCPRPPSAASMSSSQGGGGNGAPGSVVERVLAPFWATASPPGGGAGSRTLPAHQQHQQQQHQSYQHQHPLQHAAPPQHAPLVGPATGLPLPSWLKPLAQQVKLPHEVRREEEAQAAKAAQAHQAQVGGGAQGHGGPGAQGRPAWAS